MENLKASNKEFICLPSDKLNFYDCDYLLNSKNKSIPIVKELGFVVVRNLFPKIFIDEARDAYFSLFKQGVKTRAG